jgi:hypothetical protein
MSFAVLSDVNWVAVVVAAIAYFVLGALWYMPKPMATAWTRSMGWEPSEEDQHSSAIYLAPLVGVGLVAAVIMVTGWFDPKKPQPLVFAAITSGYHVLGLLLTAVIVSVWR